MPQAHAFLPDLPPHRGQRSQDQTQEAEAGRHLEPVKAEVDHITEDQHTCHHAQEQGQQKADLPLKVLQNGPQIFQGLAVEAEDDQQHTAAEPRRYAADAHHDAFQELQHPQPSMARRSPGRYSSRNRRALS